jgi:glycosyltransferase involved in cell wall biosynthesis
MPPLVSVIIPCYNSAATVARALDSALGQTYPALEVVVVDDASRDRTCEIVRARAADERVRLVALPRNGGPAAARNAGVEAARGAYVAFLDSDDEWMPGKIAAQVTALEAEPSASLCGCDSIWVFSDGLTIQTRETDRPMPGTESWKRLLSYAFVHTSYVLARRDLVLRLGGFDRDLLVGEDQDLWIRLALAGDVAWVNETLVRVNNLAWGHMRTHAIREAEYLLPMIERHVTAQRDRLGPVEARRILGRRCAQIGRNLYESGHYRSGARLVLRAIALGYRPVSHLAFLAHASAPGQWLKRRLKRRRGVAAASPS